MQEDFEQYADEIRSGLMEDSLYIAGNLSGLVYVVGQKEAADLIHSKIGGCAVSPAGEWMTAHTEKLRGLVVAILQESARGRAQKIAAELHSAVKSVRVVDLASVWPGGVVSLIEAKGVEEAARLLVQLTRDTPEWEPGAAEPDPLLALFKPLSEYSEEEAEWLVPGWIPKGQISLIAADGGIGKTTLWCHVIAALSNGHACILDPPGTTREPMKITFLTTEDSVRKKLRRKLRLAGANMDNIITPDFAEDRSGLLREVKFGTPEMDKVLRSLRPVLCIFDPVQGFTPPKVNMGSRNEMRDCMAPLISVGEDIGTTLISLSRS